jgi:putative acetyltransferase
MHIKLAIIEDLQLLSHLYEELREDEQADNVMTQREIETQMKGFLQGNTYQIYLLEDNGASLGYAMVDMTRNPYYLRHLFIRRDKRNQGLGKRLIFMLLDLLAINGIDIEVLVWNEKAIKFYQAMGFKSRYTGMRFER